MQITLFCTWLHKQKWNCFVKCIDEFLLTYQCGVIFFNPLDDNWSFDWCISQVWFFWVILKTRKVDLYTWKYSNSKHYVCLWHRGLTFKPKTSLLNFISHLNATFDTLHVTVSKNNLCNFTPGIPSSRYPCYLS